MQPTRDQLSRIKAALDGGEATSTETLQGLLLEIGGEQCWRRPRLLHRLSTILEAHQPPMATSTTHQFKPAFRGKDFSGFPLVVGEKTKIVTASNLTDEDVPLLQRHGGAHLIEPIAGTEPAAEDTPALKANSEGWPSDDAFPNALPAHSSYEKLVDDVYERVLSRLQSTGAVADLSTDEVRTVNSGILQTATEQDADGNTTVIKHSSGGPDDLPITAPASEQDNASTPNKIELPQPEPEDLHKLLKPTLQARYKEKLGKDAPADMLKEDLIKAIEAGPAQ